MARRSDRRRLLRLGGASALVGELIDRVAERARPCAMAAAGARARIEQAVARPRPRTPHCPATTRRPSSGPVAPLPPTAFRRRTCCGTSRTRAGQGVPPGAVERGPDSPTAASSRCWAPPAVDRLSQLRAGEALSAVVLHATRRARHLSAERGAGDRGARSALRDKVLLGTLSPQLLVRMGWAPRPTVARRATAAVDATIDGPRPEER